MQLTLTMMKKIFFLILPLIFLLTLSDCKKENYTLDPPGSKVEGINGAWEINKVIQVDELDLSKSERDLSLLYINEFSTAVLEIIFNSSEMTFMITPGSSGKNYLPSSGTWAFDDDAYPTKILLKDEGGTTTVLSLQGPTRPQDLYLKFSFQRSCIIDDVDTEYVGYRYEFNRK